MAFTVDLPAYGCYAPYSGVRVDTLSTPDTATEIVISDEFQDIAVGTYGGGAYNPSANVVLPSLPASATITDVRYVVIAYRESGSDITPDPGAGFTPPPPSNQPFLYLSSGARTSRFAIDDLPIGGYAGEILSGAAESLGQLQLDQPLNKVWFSYETSSGPPIHVAYLAIRVTYELSPCFQTLGVTFDSAIDPSAIANAADNVVLRDGDPATYVTGGDVNAWLDLYTGPTAVDLTVEVVAAAGAAAAQFDVELISGRGNVPHILISSPLRTIPAGGPQTSYVYTFTDQDFIDSGYTLADITARLSGSDPDTAIVVQTSDPGLMVSEASVRVGHKCYVLRQKRKYPTATGLGIGPKRHWPRARPDVTGVSNT